jgi:hypothetical protein
MCTNEIYAMRVPKIAYNPATGTAIRAKIKIIKKQEYYNKIKENRTNYIRLGCGKCIDCIRKRANERANRACLETETQKNGIFLTLTYDNEHLPKDKKLNRRDIQLFKKRLRYYTKNKIKTLECGEYGPKTQRPHYHMIIWGIERPKDANIIEQTEYGTLSSSKEIENIWGNGYITIGQITQRSIAYVSRYVSKKEKDQNTFIETSNGIGKEYWEKNRRKIIKDGQIIIEGGRVTKIPRYFKKLYDKEVINIKNKKVYEIKKKCDEVKKFCKLNKISDIIKEAIIKYTILKEMNTDQRIEISKILNIIKNDPIEKKENERRIRKGKIKEIELNDYWDTEDQYDQREAQRREEKTKLLLKRNKI